MNVPEPDNPMLDSAAYYRAILSRGGPAGSALESREGVMEPDLSDSGIRERLCYTRIQWRQVLKTHLGDKPDQHDLINKVVSEADTTLRMVRDNNDNQLNQVDRLGQLESIVRLDGSRPSFLVRNDDVDLTTSPAGDWEAQLLPMRNQLRQTLRCVGRIDRPGNVKHGFEGTGFLVGPDLLMTNRHVLDATADLAPNGVWVFRPGVSVDFGHEWQIDRPPRVRLPKRVVFAAQPLGATVNHAETDLVLIELEATADDNSFLPLDCATGWASGGAFVYIIGYPADPGLPTAESGVTLSLLDELFGSTYGYKRLAPGALLRPAELPDVALTSRTLAHDASTLGGNSGSAVTHAGRPTLAAGLHYAGRSRVPRTNWGHVLMEVLTVADSHSGTLLSDVLRQFGATFHPELTSPIAHDNL